MRSPRINLFWVLALPLAIAWAVISRLRRRFYPSFHRYQSSSKVVCIGNIHSGGSGKTPLVLEFLKRYQGLNPVVLSRGYRASLSKIGARIDRAANEGAKLFGDEPWMLSQRVSNPIYISKKRVNGMRLIERDLPKGLTLLDDGFQHLALKRDLDIICLNTDKDLRMNFCIPLGELREPVSALQYADAILLIPGSRAESHEEWKEFLRLQFGGVPQFEAERKCDGLWDGDQPLVDSSGLWCGFCGIAEPQRFVHDFTQADESARFLKAYPDHHAYSEADLNWLVGERIRAGALGFVTTDKDWYKLKSRFDKMGERLLSLRIHYELPETFWGLVDQCLAGAEC